ncbi:MAG TPA: ATP-binding protein [Candidatus Acidoferrales bacterium]|jgi:PAS domain S-box-containing protein|nr:ATP-binding protein [Candidatus Acidoferrales bacterium]
MTATIKPGIPANEAERLRALAGYQLLDTPEEELYDAFARLAADACETSSAMVTLVDESRQWFKAHLGIETRETPREIAFCSHVVAEDRMLVVTDAGQDRRFNANPLVTGEPYIRFYAGAPLHTPEGYAIGTLCVVDREPRDLTDGQRGTLQALAAALMTALEARRSVLRVFDAAHIDLFTLEPRDRTIFFASSGACRRLGYSLKELVGMPVYDVLPALEESVFDEAVASVRGGKPLVREAVLRRRDGTTYPVELRVDAAEQGRGQRIAAVAIDQTERKAAQREIDLLMRSINATSDVVLIYRVEPITGMLRLSFMNDAYTHQTGYTREEVVGRDLDSFRLAMPDDEGMREIRAAIVDGRSAEAELISYRKDGSTFWNQIAFHPIFDGGRITHWVSIERDISDEVERTSALAEEHDRLLALAQAARRLFTVFDARQLVAVVKDVARELLGAEVRVLAARPSGASIEVDQLGGDVSIPETPDPDVAAALAKRGRIVGAGQTSAIIYAGQFGDGRYVLEVCAPGGRPLRNTDLFMLDLIAEYFAVAARNVALYHELDERRSAVLELSQTKSDLIAMLAHDFRGPLTSIVGYADLIPEVAKLEEEPLEYLDAIKRAALQLSELASDTLTFSRLERNEVALQLADVDLATLVAEIVEQYADRRDVEVKVSGDARVIGDEQRLRQVFANLIDNAIKYTPGDAKPSVVVDGDGSAVTVTLQDRGIGIPAAELSTIFDRFSRASNARKLNISGTGFGLFLAKQLVQLHGGTIAVESQEGNGSAFVVTIPRRVARASAPRTVVVLDAERDASFLAYGLREGGYRVRPAATIDELAAIADAESIDAVVVNIDPLSRDQAARLRAFAGKRGVPIVTVASENAARLGASATVPRPVLAGDVMAALERLR